MSSKKIPKELQLWIEAKKKHRLSQTHIQMARELGMSPKSFGKLDNHRQEQWKAPLREFIEHLYLKRFGKEAPDIVLSFEEINKLKVQKKEVAKEQKALKKATNVLSSFEDEMPKAVAHKQTIFQVTCDEPWFSYIRNGIKPVEGRKNTPKYQKINVGDSIDFSNGKENFSAIVVEIRVYTSLEDYLKDVTFQKALPGTSSFEEAINIYHQWSTLEEIEKHGFLGIFIKPIMK